MLIIIAVLKTTTAMITTQTTRELIIVTVRNTDGFSLVHFQTNSISQIAKNIKPNCSYEKKKERQFARLTP